MGLMTDEQKDKYDFCKNYLTEVIRFALNDRLTANYYTTDSGEEYVDIVNRQGHLCHCRQPDRSGKGRAESPVNRKRAYIRGSRCKLNVR